MLAVLGKTNGNVIKEASAAALKRLGVLAVLECADQLTGHTGTELSVFRALFDRREGVRRQLVRAYRARVRPNKVHRVGAVDDAHPEGNARPMNAADDRRAERLEESNDLEQTANRRRLVGTEHDPMQLICLDEKHSV